MAKDMFIILKFIKGDERIIYHELTHAAHYAALGTVWYCTFVNAELAEIELSF